jgi:subtilase family serine protease
VRHSLLTAAVVLALAALSACSGGSMGRSMLPAQPGAPMTVPAMSEAQWTLLTLEAHPFRACDLPQPGTFACDLITSTIAVGAAPNGAPACAHMPGCYGPSDLEAAYGISSLAKSKGGGVAVAVVDAYGYKGGYSGLSKDLNTYRSAWGLPACKKGCFTVVSQTGSSKLPKPGHGNNAGWQGEEALDIDMVSAACPKCKIVLVQASSAKFSDLIGKAMPTALKMANVVSNSFGAGEFAKTAASAGWGFYDSDPHKVILASAGDFGAGFPSSSSGEGTREQQPCGFAGVVCVGGTSLTVKNGKYVKEVVWDGLHPGHECGSGNSPCATGSGCSAMVAKPSWQQDKGCTKRSASDISANADPYTGVAVVCTPCGASSSAAPFLTFDGGTSESSPFIAGMYGLAENAAKLSNPPQALWSKGGTSAFHDITSGFNDRAGITGLVCGSSIAYICKAGTHMNGTYAGPTGWGSPIGVGAL